MNKEKLTNLIRKSAQSLGLEVGAFSLEHPDEISHGDYSTNIALILAKELKMNPKELAEKIVAEMSKTVFDTIEKIEVAGAGFINFYLSSKFFDESLNSLLEAGDTFGQNSTLKGKKALVEYTDPNPFKEFHIGHLMSNTIGESISRLVQASGAETKRACYQGDVGLHVAKAVWALIKNKKEVVSAGNLGQAYAEGSKAYEDPESKIEIDAINKKIYDRSDEDINRIYDHGKTISLEHFAEIYKKLGTEFNFYFFESETGKFGKEIVLDYLDKGVFEKSEGAIIFPAEKHDPKLHTRVFINKEGLPTYEAKELGLAQIKYDLFPYDLSIVITGNEVNDYFKVLLKALELIFPELAKATKHLSHGMLRLPSGKMSSRTGSVITGESLIEDISVMVRKKIESSDRGIEDKERLVNMVAVAALKYSILKQSPGRDIIFDFEKSISFEGDSGPYLQYSYARAKSILNKAQENNIAELSHSGSTNNFLLKIFSARPAGLRKASQLRSPATKEVTELERFLYRFPEVVERSALEYAPHYLITYLTDLSRSFNAFYGETKIVDPSDPSSPHKVALTRAFSIVLKNGLNLLGIQAPEKM